MATSKILDALVVDGLCFTYPEQEPLIDHLSFTLSAGETFAIIGTSGSGKTTLLKLLNLLIYPDRGRLSLYQQNYFEEGGELYEIDEIRSKIGLVFQSFNLFPNMTALRNMIIAQRYVLRRPYDEARHEALTLSEKLGIADLVDRYPESLSGGEQQRVALARALLLQPRVLMLDEITSALDPIASSTVMACLESARQLAQFRQMSVLMVTHALPHAIRHADRIAFLEGGKFIETHQAGNLARDAKSPRLRRYLEDAGMSLG
jgi:polar amino acid transport system ATP-binding protein